MGAAAGGPPAARLLNDWEHWVRTCPSLQPWETRGVAGPGVQGDPISRHLPLSSLLLLPAGSGLRAPGRTLSLSACDVGITALPAQPGVK